MKRTLSSTSSPLFTGNFFSQKKKKKNCSTLVPPPLPIIIAMDTSVQHQQQDLIHLPEINISNKDDWDFLSKPTVETSPPPTPPHIYQPTEHNTEDQESITTGLTRALSFSRQTANTLTEKEEDVRKEVINISTSNPSHLFW